MYTCNLFYALLKPSPYPRSKYVGHICEEVVSRVSGLFTWCKLQTRNNIPVGLWVVAVIFKFTTRFWQHNHKRETNLRLIIILYINGRHGDISCDASGKVYSSTRIWCRRKPACLASTRGCVLASDQGCRVIVRMHIFVKKTFVIGFIFCYITHTYPHVYNMMLI